LETPKEILREIKNFKEKIFSYKIFLSWELSPKGKKIYLTTKLEIVKIDNKRSKPSTDLAQTVDGKLKINSNLFVRIG
jgi:hypothetical protein